MISWSLQNATSVVQSMLYINFVAPSTVCNHSGSRALHGSLK